MDIWPSFGNIGQYFNPTSVHTGRTDVKIDFVPEMAQLLLLRWEQCDQKKSPNVYKSCPKMIDFDTFTKIA